MSLLIILGIFIILAVVAGLYWLAFVASSTEDEPKYAKKGTDTRGTGRGRRIPDDE